MRHGVVPLRKTYAIGGKFLGVRDEHDDAQHDGRYKVTSARLRPSYASS